jgi:sugar lactone lactonase YvrE
VQVTPAGGAHTLRWYTDRGKLYWLTIGAQGVELRVTDDGEHFRVLRLPPSAGHPSDILRAGEHLLVLAERGLYELAGETFKLRAPILDHKTPFKVDDGYCAPPLSVFRGNIYAGDQLHGALWKLAAD